MLEVEHGDSDIVVAEGIATLLAEASAITDYRTLRDNLPRRLAHLLKCRSILFYQKVGETLQFAAGTFDDKPGWSAALLAFVHINPIALNSDEPEALAWRTRSTVIIPSLHPTHVIAPLVYRQRCLGVLVAIRTEHLASGHERGHLASIWTNNEVQAVTAITGVVAILLENTRLIERDRERVYALSQLTTISSQMTYSLYEPERLKALVIQRVREIARVDVCEMIDFSTSNEKVSWFASELYSILSAYFQEQTSVQPLVIERPGDVNNPRSVELLRYLAPEINTFFAFPLLGTRPVNSMSRSSSNRKHIPDSNVLGVVVAGYYRTWKLRREESMLIQVVVGQAGAVLENMHLVIEVVEARNEARKLLRRVLEDQRFQALILESIPSGLITIDMQGRITTFNSAAEIVLGYSAPDVVGKSLAALLNMHTTASTQEGSHFFLNASSSPLHKDALSQVLATGEPQSGTLISSDQQCQELVLDLNVQPLCDDHERQVGALVTFVDVTSVHRLEEEKRRLDRLAVLGEMAAGLAHEVRNPLASIKTSIQMLIDDLSDENQEGSTIEQSSRVEIAQASTSVMLKEVERLDTLVRDMLLFARPRQLHRVRCDVSALSDHVLHLLQVQYADVPIQIHRVYDSIPMLWVDMGQIEQALLNLYANAMQAMLDGGVLTVTYHVINGQGVDTQQWVELQVADTGIGISSKHLEDIFKPFFTTKAHGIGLGLPITRRFIEDHGGVLLVESEVGRGTTFAVRLPLITDVPEEE